MHSGVIAAAVPPANTSVPTITGTAQEGQTLTASTGTWTGTPTNYSYQWKRGVTNVGSNQNTYVPVTADVGSTITVTVTATNGNGTASATSVPTGTVAAWSPNSLLGTSFRLWADELAGSNGSSVTSWPGMNVTVTPVSSAPTLATSGIGGRKAVTFAGAGGVSGTLATPLSARATYYAVILVDNPTSTEVWLDGDVAHGSGQHYSYIDGFFHFEQSADIAGTVPILTTAMVLTLDFNGAASTMRMNGLQVAAGNTGSATLSGIVLGAHNAGGFRLHGKIALVAAYDGGRTAGQIATDEANLMTYYGITSCATNYTRTDYTDAGNGVAYRLLRPTGLADGTAAPLIIYCHGAGGDRTYLDSNVTTGNLKLALLSYLCGSGYRVAASDLNSDGWGNQQSLDRLLSLRTALASRVTSSKTILWAESMGGLVSLLSLADATNWGDVAGWLGVYPVCNLSNMFGGNAGGYAAAIRAAYGIASDGSDYSAKTAGHDPVLLSASLFDGKRMAFAAGSSDVVVTKVDNSDQMATLVTGHATEHIVTSYNGGHGSPIYYATPQNYLDFFNRC